MPSTYIPTPVFSLSDADSLAKTDLTQCVLLMAASLDQLHYTIYHPAEKKFIYLKGYYFHSKNKNQDMLAMLEQCFDSDKIIFTDFKQVKILFDDPLFTLVPAAYYSKELKKDYFAMLMPGAENQKIHHDVLQKEGIVNIYAIDKNLLGYLKKEFASVHYFHSETIFLQSVLASSQAADDRVYLSMAAERITVTVISNNKLLLAQSYPIGHIKDALYYTLNAIHQFNLAPDKVDLYLSGEVESNTPLYKELRHEIPGTHWLNRRDEYQFVSAFDEFPPHYFYNLTALASCE